MAIVPREAPDPAPGEALIGIRASGVCGTDVEIYEGRVPVEPGRVLGHEGAGVVLVAPADRPELDQGAPVVVDPVVVCGRCALCLEGRPNLCSRGGLLGRELDGLFADVAAVPVANCHLLPDAIPLGEAPAVQVLATGVHAQEQARVVPGGVAVVVGLGFAGQLHAQLLARRGARVLGVSRSAGKRQIAGRLACDWTAAPTEAPGAAREAGPPDLVVESAGTLPALALALELVRPGGTVLAYGIQTASEGSLPFYDLYRKEVRMLGTRASQPRDMEIALGLVASGAVSITPLVSDRLDLERLPEALERSAGGALKVLVAH